MKINVIIYVLLLVGVVTVVSQVAENSDASPFQHLLTKELGRMAKNIRKQLHSEMAELVEELRQKFLETTIHVETVSVNTSLSIHENMMKEKNILEDQFMKVVNYTNHQMEELTNDLQYLQLALKGDINPYDLRNLLSVSEAPMTENIFQSSDTYQNDSTTSTIAAAMRPDEVTLQLTDTYQNDSIPPTIAELIFQSNDNYQNDSTTQAIVAATTMHPEQLTKTLDISRPRSCYELYQKGNTRNGVYIIYPEGPGGMGIGVWCGMELVDGGWTVVLARLPDADHVEFDRPIHDYIIGFGQPNGHFWLGLQHLESMCGFREQELKVLIQDWDGNHAIADYNNFSITKSNESWYLQISGYDTETSERSAGDSLTSQNGAIFAYKPELGGWWHSKKGGAIPTGKYYSQDSIPQGEAAGVEWPAWKEYRTSLKKLLIMIRPKH